jgi:RNA polymerase sigma-70 factor (ECF subfamily)
MPPSNRTEAEHAAEAALVARSREGDASAFEAIYRRHAPRVFSLACRMTGSRADGEDLLQEIFLLVHRKLDGFKGEATLGTWIYRLAANCCVDFLRSRQHRDRQATEELDEAMPPVRSTGGLRVEQIDLERAIERLPPGYRAAFVLHDVEGFEHAEVARLLGIAEGTSKSQVHKARLKIRAMLASRPAASGS